MYKWKIEMWMDDGLHLEGYYVGPEVDSGKVATKLFAGSKDDFTGMLGENEKHNLYVCKGFLRAFDISPA